VASAYPQPTGDSTVDRIDAQIRSRGRSGPPRAGTAGTAAPAREQQAHQPRPVHHMLNTDDIDIDGETFNEEDDELIYSGSLEDATEEYRVSGIQESRVNPTRASRQER
jgi:hypothetical protein